jgi:TM2 domain-containing membrane protein YozV
LLRNESLFKDITMNGTHSKGVGYIMWIFGFFGIHRFYYGRQVSGTIYLFTLGLIGIGWLIDLFLIPSLDRDADLRYAAGPYDYSVAWILLAIPVLGVLGIHRFYMGKLLTGILYLCTGGIFGIGLIYDYWTLNEQLSELNSGA